MCLLFLCVCIYSKFIVTATCKLQELLWGKGRGMRNKQMYYIIGHQNSCYWLLFSPPSRLRCYQTGCFSARSCSVYFWGEIAWWVCPLTWASCRTLLIWSSLVITWKHSLRSWKRVSPWNGAAWLSRRICSTLFLSPSLSGCSRAWISVDPKVPDLERLKNG